MADVLTTARDDISREEAADRVSAYVYGNIIVLAALASITPDHATDWASIGVLFSAGLATFIAHVFSDIAGHRVRHATHATFRDVLHEASIARPIITSAVLPAIPMAAGCLGWLKATWVLPVALVLIAARLAWIGTYMARQSGQKSSWRVIGAGFLFAVLALAIGAAKVVLSH